MLPPINGDSPHPPQSPNLPASAGGARRGGVWRPGGKSGRSSDTGLCYDPRMAAHSDPTGSTEHPEDPARIRHIYRALVKSGLVNDPQCTGLSDPEMPGPLKRVMAREVTREEALLVHTEDQWQYLESTEGM